MCSLAHLNMHQPRHSYLTRLLATILPSSCYAKNDKTVDGLHQVIADDFASLMDHGVQVEVS